MASYRTPTAISDLDYLRRELDMVQASTGAEVHPFISKLRVMVPFDQFCISGLDLDDCGAGAGIYLSSNHPRQALKEYKKQGYWTVDPLVRKVASTAPIVQWEEIGPQKKNNLEACRFLHFLERHDIAPRTVVSLWNGRRIYGQITFGRRKPFSDNELETLTLFAKPLHSALATPVVERANQRFRLSDGELRCLQHAAQGLTSEEIAVEAGYSTHTVNTYLNSAVKKLATRNRTEAVAKALRRGIVS